MNCSEAEAYVSAVYDGEKVPQEFATHIANCGECRRTLADYSRMGAELRLLAMSESADLPPLPVPKHSGWQHFLSKRIGVPRFAAAALLICAGLAVATASLVQAQSHPLWFEFGYSPENGMPLNYLVATEGFDDTPAVMNFNSGNPVAVALRVKVESISLNDVVLRVRAVPARMEPTPTGVKLLGGPIGGVSLAGIADTHYKPGESLAIPVEGGGTVYLKGDVLDHQPKIAFGTPLIPAADKLEVRSPVLIEADKVLTHMEGATVIADDPSEAVFVKTADRVFAIALTPFPGASQAQANWGQISFKIGGAAYTLMAAAPIAGGDQPRRVWVAVREHPAWGPQCAETCVGAGALPK